MELRGLRATCDTHVHVLHLYSSGNQGIDLGDGQELERDTDGPFSIFQGVAQSEDVFRDRLCE